MGRKHSESILDSGYWHFQQVLQRKGSREMSKSTTHFSTLINLHLMMTMIMKMYWAVNRSCKLCYVLHMRICFILKVEVTLWDGFYYPHTTDEKIGSETLYNLPKFTELTSGLAGIQIQAWFQSWSSFPSLQQKNYMTFFFPIIKSKLPNLSKTRFMLCVL